MLAPTGCVDVYVTDSLKYVSRNQGLVRTEVTAMIRLFRGPLRATLP